ncbi:hypothetical protein [Kribbella sp. NPDC003557]|uniref:hypothetical protein n=1 Tax=Kribbella sp. NPDC003557 TaxID=3154449 RepID=UPI0033B0E164
MTDDPNRRPEDLGAKLALLTAEHPEPTDPASPVRLRIKRRQVRRRTAAAAISAAAVAAVVVVASATLGSFRSAEPGVATTTSPVPTRAMQTQHLDFRYTPLPTPWSEEPAFTTQPDSLKYAPAFYVARGSVPNESWAVASYARSGCLVVTDEGPAKSFGGADVCFDPNGQQRAQYRAIPAVIPNLSSPLRLTLVMGAVPADARKVRITAGGKTYDTDAVGTPNSNRLRFFALVVDAAASEVTEVTPLTA